MARKKAYVNTFEKDLSCYKSVVLLTLLKSYLGKIFSTYGRFQEHTCHLAAKHLRLPPLSFLHHSCCCCCCCLLPFAVTRQKLVACLAKCSPVGSLSLALVLLERSRCRQFLPRDGHHVPSLSSRSIRDRRMKTIGAKEGVRTILEEHLYVHSVFFIPFNTSTIVFAQIVR